MKLEKKSLLAFVSLLLLSTLSARVPGYNSASSFGDFTLKLYFSKYNFSNNPIVHPNFKLEEKYINAPQLVLDNMNIDKDVEVFPPELVRILNSDHERELIKRMISKYQERKYKIYDKTFDFYGFPNANFYYYWEFPLIEHENPEIKNIKNAPYKIFLDIKEVVFTE